MITCDADNLLRHIYHNGASQVEREAIEIYFREQGQEVGEPFRLLGLEPA